MKTPAEFNKAIDDLAAVYGKPVEVMINDLGAVILWHHANGMDTDEGVDHLRSISVACYAARPHLL